jgi:NAD+ kinase
MQKKIGLVVKNDLRAEKKAEEFENWLLEKRAQVVRLEHSKRIDNVENFSFVFVLGGDGTFLSAVRWMKDFQIPIIGIKFGDLGFLAEITEEKLFEAADEVLKNNFIIEKRSRILITAFRKSEKLIEKTVLNDIVINGKTLGRLVDLHTWINDRFLTTYRADGLIIATPTGSTAYSLAAGGPIISPLVPCFVINPICPFTLTNRALITPDSVKIKIKPEPNSEGLTLTFDGQTHFELTSNDEIIIEKWLYPVNMIRLFKNNYYDTLKKKLRWSGGRI